MASNIKRPIQIFNGTDWDKILLETSEDQIKSGFTQSMSSSQGYKKMPGGLVLQWLTTTISKGTSVSASKNVTLPVAMKVRAGLATCTGVNGSFNYSWEYNIGVRAISGGSENDTTIQVGVKNTSNGTIAEAVNVDILVIGEIL